MCLIDYAYIASIVLCCLVCGIWHFNKINANAKIAPQLFMVQIAIFTFGFKKTCICVCKQTYNVVVKRLAYNLKLNDAKYPKPINYQDHKVVVTYNLNIN